jgi:hypothetical protein
VDGVGEVVVVVVHISSAEVMSSSVDGLEGVGDEGHGKSKSLSF